MQGTCASAGTAAYLITTGAWQRRPLFDDLYPGRIVVRAFMYQHRKGRVQSHAYVIMPDHFHWLITLNDPLPLSGLMRSVKAWSGRAINEARHSRGAPVWQHGYHDSALRRDQNLRHAARYIAANPLRAGLVHDLGSYSLWDAQWL